MISFTAGMVRALRPPGWLTARVPTIRFTIGSSCPGLDAGALTTTIG